MGIPYDGGSADFCSDNRRLCDRRGPQGRDVHGCRPGHDHVCRHDLPAYLHLCQPGRVHRAAPGADGPGTRVPEKLAAAGHVGWTAMPAFGIQLVVDPGQYHVLGVGIGVLAQPQLVVRFMTVKSKPRAQPRRDDRRDFYPHDDRRCVRGGQPVQRLVLPDPGQSGHEAAAGGDVDSIIPLYIAGALPKWFGVVFLLTLLSAAMSTLSSQFHTMGTAISRDIYQQLAPSPAMIIR